MPTTKKRDTRDSAKKGTLNSLTSKQTVRAEERDLGNGKANGGLDSTAVRARRRFKKNSEKFALVTGRIAKTTSSWL